MRPKRPSATELEQIQARLLELRTMERYSNYEIDHWEAHLEKIRLERAELLKRENKL